MQYANVIVDISASEVDRLFSYAVPEGLSLLPGHQVSVPFGPRKVEGFVVSLSDTTKVPPEKIRSVLGLVRPEPVILPEMMELALWMKERYLCNLVDALRLMLPAEMRGARVREKTARRATLQVSMEEARAYIAGHGRARKQAEILNALLLGDIDTAAYPDYAAALKSLQEKGMVRFYQKDVRRTPMGLRGSNQGKDPELTPGQKAAVSELTRALENGGGRFLLHGVTGSGKTEVYIRLVRRALEMGKTAIVLVPEIALTPQMVRWFHARFGGEAAVLHSGLSGGERFDEWRRIRSGEARVIIGARSAVFAPARNIGVIVVDEEHETSYLSDKRPRYDAREVARYRADAAGAVLLLGSATPSISTYMRTMPGVRPENALKRIELNRRANNRPLPQVEIVDMRKEFQLGNHSIFSASLRSAMEDCLARGQQCMLFINRRGYSNFVSCRNCGKAVKCPNCDVTMTYHQWDDLLRCHYCGEVMQPPKTCPSCGSRYIKYFGAGTQKVEEEVRNLFPTVQVGRMDVDTTSTKDAHQKILETFRAGETRVLVGTQMIAKGLDFPEVTLVGVINADTMLKLPDFRAAERTYDLLEQVAGRAGRGGRPGEVVVQTYWATHPAMQAVLLHDRSVFLTAELEEREDAGYPPFSRLGNVTLWGRDERAVRQAADGMASALREAVGGRAGWEVLGPTDCVKARVKDQVRRHVMVKAPAEAALGAVLSSCAASLGRLQGINMALDVDAYDMM